MNSSLHKLQQLTFIWHCTQYIHDLVYTGSNTAFRRVAGENHSVMNPLTLYLYLVCCQIKQEPLGVAGKSLFDVRVPEAQATGLLLSDNRRVYAKESVSLDAALWGAQRYETE